MNPSNNAENYLGFEIQIEERVNRIRRNSRPLSIQDTPFIYLQPFRALIPHNQILATRQFLGAISRNHGTTTSAQAKEKYHGG